MTIFVSRRTLPPTLVYPFAALLNDRGHLLKIARIDCAGESGKISSRASQGARRQTSGEGDNALLLVGREAPQVLQQFFLQFSRHRVSLRNTGLNRLLPLPWLPEATGFGYLGKY